MDGWRTSPLNGFREAMRLPLALVPVPQSQPARQSPKLLDQLREALRSRHFRPPHRGYLSPLGKGYIFFHHVRHPNAPREWSRQRVFLKRNDGRIPGSPLIYTHALNRGPSAVRSPVDGF
jgi:hypothetical protein